MKTLTLTKPDDWHLHVRDGEQMRAALPHTARQFARAIIMPNLRPPVVSVAMALSYRDRILAALATAAQQYTFEPLMTLYLTDHTSPQEIIRAKESGKIHAVKLYPAGATTNSDAGVTDLAKCYSTLATMEKIDFPLLVHGEVTDPDVDVFDREGIFIDQVLTPMIRQFPALRIVFEHITTRDAVSFVQESSHPIAATITAHHLLLNRNAIFQGGINPHHYCLPVLKRETHRQALVEAAISGNPKFFLGTDSAPHAQTAKENACGCAGIFTAHAALELYTSVFEQAGALDRLEAFASFHGADFYRLPRNQEQIVLRKENWSVPEQFEYAGDNLIPFRANTTLTWRMT
ncbi:MAG: dihydroorotase [Nitrosomonas sp.]|nr:MAG: dihydroorotase [Nitrosomonas sp.]